MDEVSKVVLVPVRSPVFALSKGDCLNEPNRGKEDDVASTDQKHGKRNNTATGNLVNCSDSAAKK